MISSVCSVFFVNSKIQITEQSMHEEWAPSQKATTKLCPCYLKKLWYEKKTHAPSHSEIFYNLILINSCQKRERDVLLWNCSKIQTKWHAELQRFYFYFILFKELIFISLGACRMCLTHPRVMLSGAWWIIHYRPLFLRASLGLDQTRSASFRWPTVSGAKEQSVLMWGSL